MRHYNTAPGPPLRLNEAWVNEKLSPYLLETQQEVVDCLIEQCNNVENNFEQASPFAVGIHQLELQVNSTFKMLYYVFSLTKCITQIFCKDVHHLLFDKLI